MGRPSFFSAPRGNTGYVGFWGGGVGGVGEVERVKVVGRRPSPSPDAGVPPAEKKARPLFIPAAAAPSPRPDWVDPSRPAETPPLAGQLQEWLAMCTAAGAGQKFPRRSAEVPGRGTWNALHVNRQKNIRADLLFPVSRDQPERSRRSNHKRRGVSCLYEQRPRAPFPRHGHPLPATGARPLVSAHPGPAGGIPGAAGSAAPVRHAGLR